MAAPVIAVKLALSTNPTEAPSWVDVSAFWRSISIRRGRQRELEQIQAGEATVTLDNRDGRFDPNYAGAIVNLCANPSLETGTTGWSAHNTATLSRVAGEHYMGGTALQVDCQGTGIYEGAKYDLGTITPDTTYVGSLYVKRSETTRDIYLELTDGVASGTVAVPKVTGWQRAELSLAKQLLAEAGDLLLTEAGDSLVLDDAATTLSARVWQAKDPPAVNTFYLDALQIEQAAAATAYADGDQDNCRWAGTAHASQSYRGGPYYGYLLPLRRLRISASRAGQEYDLFTGYVEGFPPLWPGWADAVVTVKANDGLAVIAGKKLTADYAEQRTDQRISAVLDAVNWTTGEAWVLGSTINSVLGTTTILGPVGDRALGEGESTMQAQSLDGANALSHLQTVMQVENGALFVDVSGAVAFRSRHAHLYNQTSQATYGDATGELPYSALVPSLDQSLIYNEVTVEPIGYDPVTVQGTASQAKYFIRSLPSTAQLPLGGSAVAAEAQSMATWLRRRHEEPLLRFDQLQQVGGRDEEAWPHILGRELFDCVTVRRRPTYGGTIEQLCYIERIEHDIRHITDWHCSWQLDTADTVAYWRLGESKLGVSTTLGY